MDEEKGSVFGGSKSSENEEEDTEVEKEKTAAFLERLCGGGRSHVFGGGRRILCVTKRSCGPAVLP